jgi:hypothetical protein
VPAPKIDQEKVPVREDRTLKVDADASKGFSWPYFLFIPGTARGAAGGGGKASLLVIPNNTGESGSQPLHEIAARFTLAASSLLARDLKTPLLVPVFPRPPDLYTHSLDRATLQSRQPGLERLDLQLLAMADDASVRLSAEGMETDSRLLMAGFSASGMFVSRFALLHPERVRAAAIGSPGGWPMVPAAVWQGARLRYPLGIADLKDLTGKEADLAALKAVNFYFYLGSLDTNDNTPFEDQDRLVFYRLGENPVARWPLAEEIYRSVGMASRFVLFSGAGHEITADMQKGMTSFFLEAPGRPSG